MAKGIPPVDHFKGPTRSVRRPSRRFSESDYGAAGVARGASFANGESWLSPKRFRAMLLFGCMILLVVRVIMLVNVLHSNPRVWIVQGDAEGYWSAAERIAGGVFVGDEPFLFVPLYSFALAALRAVGGELSAVYVAQMLIHVATALVVAMLASRKFGRATGLVAFVVFALLEEPAFLVSYVLPGTLQLALVVGVLAAADSFATTRSARNAAWLGSLTGLLALLFPPTLVLLPVIFIWMLRSSSAEHNVGGSLKREPGPKAGSRTTRTPSLRSRFTFGLLAVSTGCAVVLPVTLHNWLACDEVIPITAHAGITFNQGNAPGADGVYVPVAGISQTRATMHSDTARVYLVATGRRGSFRDVDRYFWKEGLRYLVTDLPRAGWLAARKFYWFVTGRHYGDIYHISLEKHDGLAPAGALAALPVAWIMGPALVGFVVGWRRRRFNVVDLSLAAIPLLVVIAFWYTPRYRLPALPLLSIAAAVGITAAWQRIRDKRGLATPVAVAILVLMSLVAGRMNEVSGFDLAEAYRPQYEFNRGQVYLGLKRYGEALGHFVTSDLLAPERPEALIATAETLMHLDRLADAEHACQRLVERHSGRAVAWLKLGQCQLRVKKWADALGSFQQAIVLDSSDPNAHLGIWFALSNSGGADSGDRHLLEALRLDPSNTVTLCEYGSWLARQGRFEEAADQIRTCLARVPGRPDMYCQLGWVSLRLAKPSEARAAFEEALRIEPDFRPAHEGLAEIELTSDEG